MLKRIKRLNSGIFRNYQPDNSVPDFEKYNLIYGFNGSGKTTLSRVLRHLEIGSSSKTLNASFEIVKEKNEEELTQDSHLENLRVFNSDFVDENVYSFCGGQSNAPPILILGVENKEKVAELEKTKIDIESKEKEYAIKKTEKESNEKYFKNLKTDVARKIETEAGLGRGYNARKLEPDFKGYVKNDDDKLVGQHLKIQSDTARGGTDYQKIPSIEVDVAPIEANVKSAKNLLEKDDIIISLSNISDHSSMLSWIDKGHRYHKSNDVKNCLFCDNVVSEERVAVLEKLFNESYQNKIKEIGQLIDALLSDAGKLKEIKEEIPHNSQIDETVASDKFNTIVTIKKNIDRARSLIKSLIDSLEKKMENLSLKINSILDFSGAVNDIRGSFTELNRIIQKHNQNIDNAETQKTEAQKKVKNHYLHMYADELREKVSFFETSENELDILKTEDDALKNRESEISRSVSPAEIGADKINTMLKQYLGHGELSVLVETNDDGVEGYRLCRDGEFVKTPPSEGEITAIAIIYFLIKLEEYEAGKNKLIVVIDDPVSSMDGNSLTYAANLIWAKTEECTQVFYLTHNLHFMNLVKKWLKNKTSSECDKNKTAEIFVLEANINMKEGIRNASLREMPKVLLNNNSEYEYCFSLVKNFSKLKNSTDCQILFNMPNLIRRVFESFVQFKLPKSSNISSVFETNFIKEKIPNESQRQALHNVFQKHSHSDSQDSFSQLPDFEEYMNVAKTLMDFIEQADEQHYTEMCKMIQSDNSQNTPPPPTP